MSVDQELEQEIAQASQAVKQAVALFGKTDHRVADHLERFATLLDQAGRSQEAERAWKYRDTILKFYEGEKPTVMPRTEPPEPSSTPEDCAGPVMAFFGVVFVLIGWWIAYGVSHALDKPAPTTRDTATAQRDMTYHAGQVNQYAQQGNLDRARVESQFLLDAARESGDIEKIRAAQEVHDRLQRANP